MNMELLYQVSGVFGRWQKLTKTLLALTVGLAFAASAQASHFRGANLTWKKLASPANTIELTIIEAWRVGADDTLTYTWGDGSASFTSNSGTGETIIATDPAFIVTRTKVTHTYAGAGPYTITGSSCCRISTLSNGHDQSETVTSVVDLRNNNSGAPSITSPIILQMVQGGVNTVPLAFSDVDGDPVTFRLATPAEMGGGTITTASAGGHTIAVSSDGTLTWDTSGTAVGQLYAVQVIASDNHPLLPSGVGSTHVSFDFIVEIVDGSINHPPVATGNSGPFVVAVGQTFTNVITGTDQDGGNLTVTHQGLPAGATLTPASGTSGPQPLAATFTWTPTANDSGASVGVTIVFTDPTGLQASKSFSISVPANQPPTANAGPNQTVDASATCDALVQLSGSGSDPENGPITYSWSGAFGTVSGQNPTVTLPVGQNTVTLTVTDNKGATGTSTTVITVKDVTAPTLSVPADLSISNDPGKCGAVVSFTTAASDNCSGVSVVSTPASGSFFPLGTTVVTSVATDAAGNTTTKTFNVTVSDTEKPVVASLGDLIVHPAAGACAANVDLTHAVSVSDNCAGASVSFSPASGSLFGKGTTVVTATATDAAGNTSSTTLNVTVLDSEPPTIVAQAANKTVECDVAGNAAALSAWLASNGGASATDNCGAVIWTNNYRALTAACGATGSATVVFTATDSSGNSSTTTATFTIVDTTAPAIVAAAANKTVECDGTGNTAALNAWLASNGGASATDAGGTVKWSNNFTALTKGVGATGSTTVTFTATDACGNTSTTTATFAIVDTTAPAIVTPAANKTVECDGAGNTAALSAWVASNGGATATDGCGSVKWSNNFTALTKACGATGSATVTFTATDDSGNTSTTTATFAIVDTTKPTIVATASNKTVETDGAGNTAALSAWLASNGGASATDGCGTVKWSNNYTATTFVAACGTTGTATVTFTATDECGNASTSTATFTIVDTTKPVLSSNVHDIAPNIKPDVFVISSTDVGGTSTPSIVKVTATRVNAAGKLQDFTDAYQHTVAGNQLTIQITGGVDTLWTIYASSVDACGNTATATYYVHVVNPTALK